MDNGADQRLAASSTTEETFRTFCSLLWHGSPATCSPAIPYHYRATISVTTTTPSYLRIHQGPRTTAASKNNYDNAEAIEGFWQAFGDATGWRVAPSKPRSSAGLKLLPNVNCDSLADPSESSPSVTQNSALRLAESATRLAEQLIRSRESLRQQEMELAARATIISDADTRQKLADRIGQILANAAEACGCDAAALYLLDDDTQVLNTRAVYGLPLSRLEDAPRELRGSRGDLEALVRNVVTVDEFHAGGVDTWSSPEPFQAGICASLLDDSVPIGTLWLFADEVKAFKKSDQAAARMAAAAISCELSRAAASREQKAQHKRAESIADLTEWQHLSLPTGNELAPGWRADGMIESPCQHAIGWHTWDILPDGTIMMAIGESVDPSLRGAVQAVVARSAMTAHSGYRHSPAQMIQRIGDSLWQTNSGDQLMSMLYFQIDPETGDGSFAAAGSITAMISSRYGYRPLVDGRSESIGVQIDVRPATGSFSLLQGETLLAFTDGLSVDGATQTFLGDCLRTSMAAADKNPLAAIRRKMVDRPLTKERGAMTLLRN
ncbi:PP2C family protein-serine/threonine phosphatase [Novipirellula artificiosorum]|uniref:Stage II sporulation protein E (SpoIIE) n=1 Tax=Novipirellula artificiosorum TaxID=2528016 RepID=A0A5C6DIY7_9BACT|nr:SpoIIE family protein phosphatase [Novipirellula artificiosorum]TWU36064.1 Stage II sporulation protein E (SpoIIE) [Novipirellula artificiosorum]